MARYRYKILQKKNIKKIYTGETYNFDNKAQVCNRINILKKKYSFKGKKLLDIGGGTNPFLSYVKGAKRWVADFKINKNLKKHKISFIEGDFLNNNISENFDYIFLFHTLEHLEKTNLYLKKIHKILNNNGKLIIEVPNAEFDLKKNPYYIFFHMHITVYYEKTLVNLLKMNGFKKDIIFNKKDVLFFSFKKEYSSYFSFQNKYFLQSKKIIKRYSDNMQKINNFFVLKGIKIIGIFGAGGSTNLLVSNSDYLKKHIKYILDNDNKKENLYLFNNKVGISKPSNDILLKIDTIIILDENHKNYIPNKYRKKIINITDIINAKQKYRKKINQ